MSFIKRIIRTKLGGSSPIISVSEDMTFKYLEAFDQPNKYMKYAKIYEIDSTVRSCIDRIAVMASQSYCGLVVEAGRQLDENERKLLNDARSILDQLKFDRMIESITKHLLIYGDDIWIITEDGMMNLPIAYMTILESREQLNQMGAQIFKRGIYVLNEGSHEGKEKVYDNDRILHFSLDNASFEVKDLKGRYTFGVWCISPLETLSPLVYWKQLVLINDAVWRARNVPREHHKLDLSIFDPSRYPGSIDEKIKKAKADAEHLLDEYSRKMYELKTGKYGIASHYVTGKEVEISYVSPSGARYMSPNELMMQLDSMIVGALGSSLSAVRGVSTSSYASELVTSSFMVLNAVSITKNICNVMLQYLRKQLRGLYPEELLRKLKFDVKLRLPYEIGELMRQAALMVSTGCFTIDEVRQFVGYEELREDQVERLVGRGGVQGRVGDYSQSVQDVKKTETTQLPDVQHPLTPESRRDMQVT